MRKGQVSLEMLLLLSVMVGVLYLSLSLLSRTYSLGSASIGNAASESLLRGIATAANEVCAMGEGNSRIVESSTIFSLSYADGSLSLSNGKWQFSRKVDCLIVAPQDSISGKILVKNTGPSVSISQFSPE